MRITPSMRQTERKRTVWKTKNVLLLLTYTTAPISSRIHVRSTESWSLREQDGHTENHLYIDARCDTIHEYERRLSCQPHQQFQIRNAAALAKIGCIPLQKIGMQKKHQHVHQQGWSDLFWRNDMTFFESLVRRAKCDWRRCLARARRSMTNRERGDAADK